MNRFITLTLTSVFALLAVLSLAAGSAQAGSLRVSFDMGAQQLYPKTAKRLAGYKAQMARLARAYKKARRAGDRSMMDRIAARHGELAKKFDKGMAKLKTVRGTTRVTVWGDARNTLSKSEIATFLRKKRSWQGTSVHIYALGGSQKIGARPPARYDGMKGHSSPAKPPTSSGGGKPAGPSGSTPVAGGGVGSGAGGGDGGLFGVSSK